MAIILVHSNWPGLVRGLSGLQFSLLSGLQFSLWGQAFTSPWLCLWAAVEAGWPNVYWLWGLAQAWYSMYEASSSLLSGCWRLIVLGGSSPDAACSVVGNWNWGLISKRRPSSLLWHQLGPLDLLTPGRGPTIGQSNDYTRVQTRLATEFLLGLLAGVKGYSQEQRWL